MTQRNMSTKVRKKAERNRKEKEARMLFEITDA